MMVDEQLPILDVAALMLIGDTGGQYDALARTR